MPGSRAVNLPTLCQILEMRERGLRLGGLPRTRPRLPLRTGPLYAKD